MFKLRERHKPVLAKESSTLQDKTGVYLTVEEMVRLNTLANKLAFPRPRSAKRPQFGSHHSRFKGRGMEFAEVRPYQPGDDVRSIDWRVTARKQAPHTKLFQEERERPVVIVCDQSPEMFFGSKRCLKSVLAAEAAALLAWSALAHNDRVGGIVFSGSQQATIKPARNRKTILRLFKQIEEFNHALNANVLSDFRKMDSNHNPLGAPLKEACQVVKPGSLVFVISDFLHLDDATTRHFSALAKHNDLVLMRCIDPLERTLPVSSGLPVRDGDDIFYLSPNATNTKNALSDWYAQLDEKLSFIERRCRANIWNITTAESLETQLHEIALSVGGGSRK